MKKITIKKYKKTGPNPFRSSNNLILKGETVKKIILKN
jgi:hypothetical protein